MADKVKLRAEQAFYQHGLHNTKERTGILLLVSLLERRVHVLADKAINDRVPPGTWDGLDNGILDGIRTGNATDAICEAIGSVARSSRKSPLQVPATIQTSCRTL